MVDVGWVFVFFLSVVQAASVVQVASVEDAAKAIDRQVVSPCCFSQTVDQHRSGAAKEVRTQIREWLAAGQTEQVILDRLVEQHGQKILAVPRAEGFNTAVWWMPVVAVLIGAIGLRSYLSRTASEQRQESPAMTESDKIRLEAYLG